MGVLTPCPILCFVPKTSPLCGRTRACGQSTPSDLDLPRGERDSGKRFGKTALFCWGLEIFFLGRVFLVPHPAVDTPKPDTLFYGLLGNLDGNCKAFSHPPPPPHPTSTPTSSLSEEKGREKLKKKKEEEEKKAVPKEPMLLGLCVNNLRERETQTDREFFLK